MVLDTELKRMIQQGTSQTDMRIYLAQSGWRTLREKALTLVEQGESTLEEVLRVTRSETVEACDPTGDGCAEALP